VSYRLAVAHLAAKTGRRRADLQETLRLSPEHERAKALFGAESDRQAPRPEVVTRIADDIRKRSRAPPRTSTSRARTPESLRRLHYEEMKRLREAREKRSASCTTALLGVWAFDGPRARGAWSSSSLPGRAWRLPQQGRLEPHPVARELAQGRRGRPELVSRRPTSRKELSVAIRSAPGEARGAPRQTGLSEEEEERFRGAARPGARVRRAATAVDVAASSRSVSQATRRPASPARGRAAALPPARQGAGAGARAQRRGVPGAQDPR